MTRAFYEPLGPRDAWFLYAERRETPLDIGTVYIFEGGSRVPGGAGAAAITDSIARRLHLVPRYRQKIRWVGLSLGHPVWVDDRDFDLDDHVRHVALPPPGDGTALRRLVAQTLRGPLDRRRPLWEMVVIHGLRKGRIAVCARVHHAMVDGMANIDIMSTLFDASPDGGQQPDPVPWQPRPAPSSFELMRRELWNPARGERPAAIGLRTRLQIWLASARGMPSLGRTLVARRSDLFFNRQIGFRRSGRGIKLPLPQIKELKRSLGCTVNDAVLTIVAEGLHRWLVARGGAVPERVRVFVPVSVRRPGEEAAGGNRLSGLVVELPTGELPIRERLNRISSRMGELKRSGQAVAASQLMGLADWAPAGMLVLAGRLMSSPQAGANMNVTNVPGPQFPLYSGGAELLEAWPFAPLYPSMGLGIALVSYNGNLYFGLTADPGLVPDIEEFSRHLSQAAASSLELVSRQP